jgi:hypothetical protein
MRASRSAPPDAGAFWRVVAEYGVVALFTAPTALRAIKKEDPEGRLMSAHDISSLRTLFLAGERADPDTVRWAQAKLGVPVVDHWWQTETGWAIAGNPVGLGRLPVPAGSTGVPMPGYRVDILDEAGHVVEANRMGAVAIRLPMPPGCLPTLWEQKERFVETYLTEFPGYYKTADAGFRDPDGNLFIMGRTDDIINVAGHRLSTGGMEEVLASHPDVAECAVIGVHDEIKGEVPCGFVVLKAGVARGPDEIEREIVAMVRERVGPVAAFRLAITVSRLPKTRSGQDLARHDEEDRRRRGMGDAGDHRRPGHARRDRRRAEDPRLRPYCAGGLTVDQGTLFTADGSSPAPCRGISITDSASRNRDGRHKAGHDKIGWWVGTENAPLLLFPALGLLRAAELGEHGLEVERVFLLALGRRIGLRRLGVPGGDIGRQQGRTLADRLHRTILGGTLHLDVEVDLRAQAERHRIHRRQVLRIPVGALLDRFDGGLGGADQPHDLAVLQLRMVAQQPENGIRPILALRHRGVARPAAALRLGQADLGFEQLQPMVRVLLGAVDLLTGELAGGDRVAAFDALRDFAVRNALHLQRMEVTEGGDLLEAERGVLDQPNGGGLRHQGCVRHGARLLV